MARVRIPLTRTKASQMPPACMICGDPVDAHVPRTFTWRPSILSTGFWISVFFCMPLALVFLVVGISNTLRVTVECPVCDRHRGYWAWRGFWLSAPLLVITVVALTVGILLVLRVVEDEAFGYFFLAIMAAILGWIVVAAILRQGGVRVEQINEDDITLEGVDPTFAGLMGGELPRREPARDYGWEDYDPYPRRPTLP